jgi:hypothetical protein
MSTANLSTYDPVKGCFVLAPMTQPIINAFHPDYIKVHQPDLMKEFRTAEANRKAALTLSNHVTEQRKINPLHGYVDLTPRDFFVYQRAGVK